MNYLKKGLFFLLLIFLALSFIRNISEYRKNLSFHESYRIEYEKEMKRNTELKTQKMRKSDPNEIEKIIRNKLNLLRENEVAIILPSPSPTPSNKTTPTPPVYKQWARVFFDL